MALINQMKANAVSDEMRLNFGMADTIEIDALKVQLSKAQTAESHIEEGVSLLQEKNKAANSLKDMSQKLKQLSSEYNSNTVDKQEIEKQAKEIITEMDNVINSTFGDKSATKDKQISVETNHGSNIIIDRKFADIRIDSDINKSKEKDGGTGYHIEGELNVENILKNTTNRIENNLIKPLDKYSDNIKDQMVSVVNDAMYQDMAVTMSAKELRKFKAIDGYTESKIIKNSNDILKNASEALYCQSSNLGNHIDVSV
ncbi:hypothetical protein [Clostridium sp. JN-1]|uniref:hypothetical protein n=1 Tax=Clostridium sp. JN-1 TaxID=2483110 RepID=UPI0012378B68|nr:hypothetical protein [Clostridium sp. JN-1]